MPESRIAALLSNYDLPASFIYLAPLFPLVRAMWADGDNQFTEQQIVRTHLYRHSNALKEQVGGMEVIPEHELNWFVRDFIESKPDDGFLEDVTALSLELVAFRQPNKESIAPELFQREALLHACLEIVAACMVELESSSTNSETVQRIADQERHFINELFVALYNQNGA